MEQEMNKGHVNAFRKVCKEGYGVHKLSDRVIGLTGTDEEVWEVICRLVKERNAVKEIPEHLKMTWVKDDYYGTRE